MKFAVIGCGNVAWHYSNMWIQEGHQCLFGYSRNAQNFNDSMSSLGIAFQNPNQWNQKPDAVLLAVPDDQILQVALSLPLDLTLIIPSGSFDFDSLPHPNRMVIWGIYSFILGTPIDYQRVPFCIESTPGAGTDVLHAIMESWKDQIHITTQEQRTHAHMAAVFSNNFVTSLYQTSFDILKEQHLPFDLVLATIQQLAEKLNTEVPERLQTGPAKRNDLNTLKKHLALLEDTPAQKHIYENLSNYILQKYGHPKL